MGGLEGRSVVQWHASFCIIWVAPLSWVQRHQAVQMFPAHIQFDAA